MAQPLISIIVPVLNEDQNIHRLYKTVNETLAPLASKYDIEFVFTDNHSTDNSYQLLQSLAENDERVRVIRFSRNFGYQASIMTGYLNARGDAAIQLDCDLQDPPAMIHEFIQHWEQGYKVVFGVRKQRKEGWFVTALRKVFYRVINALSEHPLPIDAGDFRLVDRRIIEELRKTNDATPYLRGKIATLGFQQIGIPYDREARTHGESKFSFSDLMRLAVDGILNHSTAPLRLATYCSQLIFLGALVVIAVYCVGRLTVGRDWPAGFTTLSALVLLSTSLNALFFGIMGEYIGRIYRQVKQSPLTIVEDSVNVDQQSSKPVVNSDRKAA